MAHKLKINSRKNTFGVFNEPQNAGDYINNKKAKASFCKSYNNRCLKLKNTYCSEDSCFSSTINSQNNLLLLKRAAKIDNNFKYVDYMNTSNLNMNLITKLNLANVNVVNPTHVQPPNIDAPCTTNIPPYLYFNIDPDGSLFGNTTCGINNFLNYVECNDTYKTQNPGYINHL